MYSWFTKEPYIKEINALLLDVIGMVEALKQRYRFIGEFMNQHKLYNAIPDKVVGDNICSAVKRKEEY